MANADRPRGFTPVKFTSGAPYRGEMRTVGITDAKDIYVGDPIIVTTGLALQCASGSTAVGVAMGFGKRSDVDGYAAGAFDPENLDKTWHDDSDGTHTDYVCFYVPVQNMIFEVQSDIDASAAVVGTVYDTTATGTLAGSAGGRSAVQLTTDSNHDIEVVELPQAPDNDATLINASYYVQFVTDQFAQA